MWFEACHVRSVAGLEHEVDFLVRRGGELEPEAALGALVADGERGERSGGETVRGER